MPKFVHIRSSAFPILAGEKSELVNEGTYGKALAEFLHVQSAARGYDSPFVCCEDWGWWVELKGAPFAFGVCVYCLNSASDSMEFVCTDGALSSRKWSWNRFRFVDTAPWTDKLLDDLAAIFDSSPDVETLGIFDEFPASQSGG